MALLTVLALLMLMTASSASLIWMMNQQQTRAGGRLRSTAALAVAEAGVQRALSILESVAPDGTPGRGWRPAEHTETVHPGASAGRFTLSLADEPDGAILITSIGEVAATARRLRARVYLASPAALVALFGRGAITLDSQPATISIVPYGAALQGPSWLHIAAGSGIEFASKDVTINGSMGFDAAPGPLDPPAGTISPALRSPGPARILLSRGAALTLGPDRRYVDIEHLRAMGIRVGETIRHAGTLPALPEVDRAYYRRLAARNTDNAALNEAAGKHSGDAALAGKRDSVYDWTEFERLTMYLWTERLPGPLRGVIYVKDGGASLFEGQRLQIVDGALIAESTVYLAPGASLEVTHSPSTRTLPAIITLDKGALTLTRGARLRVHGLVYVNGTIDAGRQSRLDVVGAVLSDDPEFSFRTLGASVVIRYDPAVLGTPGLKVPTRAPVVAWIAAWEELP